MKCKACKYERKKDWINDENTVGDEEFIDINISGSYEDRSGYFARTRKINLYMCPKCGTIRGEN